VSHTRAVRSLAPRHLGGRVVLDNAQRFGAGKHNLHGAHHNALERITAWHGQLCVTCRFLRDGRQLREIEVEPRHRTYHVRSPSSEYRMQRVRVLYMLFYEMLFILDGVDVETFARYQSPLIEWILIGMRQRHEFVVVLE